jgi:HAD superfamily hydrolase (TIGR01509 family)
VRLPQAVLWDLDGTLADSEPLWAAAFSDYAELHGIPWTDADQLVLRGGTLDLAAAELGVAAKRTIPTSELQAAILPLLAAELRTGSVLSPGRIEALSQLADAGIPQAIVTSSYREVAEAFVESLPFNPFQFLVTFEDISVAKPHPEPYITALAILGADASRCVVVEDSASGIASATAAGCRVISVYHDGSDGLLHTAERSLALADFDLDRWN